MNRYLSYRGDPVDQLDPAGTDTLPHGTWLIYEGNAGSLDKAITNGATPALDAYKQVINGINKSDQGFYVFPPNGEGGPQTVPVTAGHPNMKGLFAANYVFWQFVMVCSKDGPFTATAHEDGATTLFDTTTGVVVRQQPIQVDQEAILTTAAAKTPKGQLDEWAVNSDGPGSAIATLPSGHIRGFEMDFHRTVTIHGSGGRTTSDTVHVHIKVDQNGFVDKSSEVH